MIIVTIWSVVIVIIIQGFKVLLYKFHNMISIITVIIVIMIVFIIMFIIVFVAIMVVKIVVILVF